MTIDQLTSALRAGWSSNDRFGRLGLYGVGFNIATARLGHVAVVRTARAEDPTWTVVTLDLRELARSDHYDLPVTTEPKAQGDHGTTVVIRELKEEHHETLSRQQTKIRNILGDPQTVRCRVVNAKDDDTPGRPRARRSDRAKRSI